MNRESANVATSVTPRSSGSGAVRAVKLIEPGAPWSADNDGPPGTSVGMIVDYLRFLGALYLMFYKPYSLIQEQIGRLVQMGKTSFPLTIVDEPLDGCGAGRLATG